MPHLRSGLLADLLNLLKLLIGGLLCVLLGLLVAAGVLFAVSRCPLGALPSTIFLHSRSKDRQVCTARYMLCVATHLRLEGLELGILL